MADWNPNAYLTFKNERTQPCIDLVTRIQAENPSRIIDIGCGPGNSTVVLKNRWPEAEVTGLDSSAAMLQKAKENFENIIWFEADASGDLSALGSFDILFSNAALQWIPDHHVLLPRLFDMLTETGVMAVQVPYIEKMPIHIGLRELAESFKWRGYFSNMTDNYVMHTSQFLYEIISKLTNRLDLWQTDYIHIMDSHAAIVSWFSATGLRPYLNCLHSAALINDFLNDFENIVRESYQIEWNGKILFPFTRLFFIAQKFTDGMLMSSCPTA